MAIYGYVWLCMAIYGYVCMHVWPFMYDYGCMMYAYERSCMALHDNIWLFMAMKSHVWLGMAMYGYVWLCMAMYDNVWLCIKIIYISSLHSKLKVSILITSIKNA